MKKANKLAIYSEIDSKFLTCTTVSTLILGLFH